MQAQKHTIYVKAQIQRVWIIHTELQGTFSHAFTYSSSTDWTSKYVRICFIDTSTTPAYYWSPTTLFMTVNCVVNVRKSVITSGLIGHPVIDSDVRKSEVYEAVTYTSSTFWTVNRNWGAATHYRTESLNWVPRFLLVIGHITLEAYKQ